MSGIRRWRESGHLEWAVETAGGQDAFDEALAEMLDEARAWRTQVRDRTRQRTGK